MRNRCRCKLCGDVIESKYRHDFVWCKCKAIFTDGGHDYIRRGGSLENIEHIPDEDGSTPPWRDPSGQQSSLEPVHPE